MTGPEARRFFVTGAASGIGRALVGAIAAGGARAVATDLREDVLREAAAGWPADRVHARALDVRDAAAWEAALDDAWAAMGGVDVLMNVAGYLRPGWAHETPADEVARHLDVNARGVMLGTMATSRRMAAAGGGHVVNIASMAALAPVPGLALYSASKYAVRAFSLAVAYELRPHGVAVTVVCPDAVQTPMLDLQKDYAEAAITFSGPRALTPDEVVAALLGPVLEKKPLLLALPAARGRRWLALLVDLFPRLAFAAAPRAFRQGRAKQSALKR